MIRLSQPKDAIALIAIAKALDFQAHELEQLQAMLDSYFQSSNTSNAFWLTDENQESTPVGVAYCEQERMAHQTWNLQLIAIRPEDQGRGRGMALIQAVEQYLITQNGRMLLVETSGLPEFERTRHFYLKCGYEPEGRIRDFYRTGDDKVIFRKVLSPHSMAD